MYAYIWWYIIASLWCCSEIVDRLVYINWLERVSMIGTALSRHKAPVIGLISCVSIWNVLLSCKRPSKHKRNSISNPIHDCNLPTSLQDIIVHPERAFQSNIDILLDTTIYDACFKHAFFWSLYTNDRSPLTHDSLYYSVVILMIQNKLNQSPEGHRICACSTS